MSIKWGSEKLNKFSQFGGGRSLLYSDGVENFGEKWNMSEQVVEETNMPS